MLAKRIILSRRALLLAGAALPLASSFPVLASVRPPAGRYTVYPRGNPHRKRRDVIVTDGERLPVPFRIGQHRYAGLIIHRFLTTEQAVLFYSEYMRTMRRSEDSSVWLPGFISARAIEPVKHTLWGEDERLMWIKEQWAPPNWDGWETNIQCVITEWQPCLPSA